MINFLEQDGGGRRVEDLDGIALAPDWSQTLMRDAHYTQ